VAAMSVPRTDIPKSRVAKPHVYVVAVKKHRYRKEQTTICK
jgi:hypothetical protein